MDIFKDKGNRATFLSNRMSVCYVEKVPEL